MRVGRERQPEFLEHEIMAYARLEVPAVVQVVVICGKDVWREKWVGCVEEVRIIDGNTTPDFVGLERIAVGIQERVMPRRENQRADEPVETDNRANFLEG